MPTPATLSSGSSEAYKVGLPFFQGGTTK